MLRNEHISDMKKKIKSKKRVSGGRMPSNKSKNSKVKKLIKLAMQKKSKKAKKRR
jgi:hypothetical protein